MLTYILLELNTNIGAMASLIKRVGWYPLL